VKPCGGAPYGRTTPTYSAKASNCMHKIKSIHPSRASFLRRKNRKSAKFRHWHAA
jgi:hypothetical protein